MIDNVLACHEVFPTYMLILYIWEGFTTKMSTNVFFDLYFLEYDRMVSHSLFLLFWQFGPLQLLTMSVYSTLQLCSVACFANHCFFRNTRSKISCLWHVINIINLMQRKNCKSWLFHFIWKWNFPSMRRFIWKWIRT